MATIQSLSNREHPVADIVIIDECHHAKASTYKKLWDIYPEARFLGVTATPIRMSGEGFSDLFDTLINCGKLSQFVTQGYLVDLDQWLRRLIWKESFGKLIFRKKSRVWN